MSDDVKRKSSPLHREHDQNVLGKKLIGREPRATPPEHWWCGLCSPLMRPGSLFPSQMPHMQRAIEAAAAGQLALDKRDWAGARVHFQAALQACHSHEDAALWHFSIAHCAFELKEYQNSVAAYTAAIELDPQDTAARTNRA
jgi:hypothetical protein